MSAIDTEPFPRGALIGAGLVVGLSLAITAGARISHLLHPAPAAPSGPPPAESVDLRFLDQADGSVAVRAAADGHSVATLAPGTNGFVSGVLRGLARERMRRGIGEGPPFVLERWTSGRLALEDHATGRVIDLDAFGATNKDAFMVLLPGRAPA